MTRPRLTMWKGKFLEEMTKDELIAALRQMGDEASEYQTDSNRRASALGRVEMIKRGEA